MQETQEQLPLEKPEVLQGIRGWLFVLAIILCFIPVKLVLAIKTLFLSPDAQSMFYIFGSSESAFHIPGFGAALMVEFFGNLFFFFAGLGLIYLFFKHYYLFPKLFQIFLVCNILFLLGDYIITQSFDILLPETENMSLFSEIIQTMISGAIWGTYVQRSKRVKNTFIFTDLSKNTAFPKVVIAISCLSLLTQLGNIDFDILSQGRTSESIFKDTPIKIATGIYIDTQKYKLSPNDDISDIANNTQGFLGERGNFVMTVSEEFDKETQENLELMEPTELLEISQSLFEDDMGVTISTGSIEKIGNQTIYICMGDGENNGTKYSYYMGYTFSGQQGVSFYTYGFHKDIIQSEGKKLLQSIYVEKK